MLPVIQHNTIKSLASSQDTKSSTMLPSLIRANCLENTAIEYVKALPSADDNGHCKCGRYFPRDRAATNTTGTVTRLNAVKRCQREPKCQYSAPCRPARLLWNISSVVSVARPAVPTCLVRTFCRPSTRAKLTSIILGVTLNREGGSSNDQGALSG